MLVPLPTLAIVATGLLSSAGLVDALSASDIPSDTPISSLLSSANAHLARGQTSDALVYYDAAVARDPSDYLTYFKRATTYLSLGRTSQATEDFDQVLKLRPGFEGAHLQLGKIKAKGADWEGAKEQYTLAKQTAGSPEFDKLLEAQGAARLAEEAAAAGKWDECIAHAGEAIMTASRASSLRKLRSRCRFQKGEVEEGMSDLQHVIQMQPGDITPHLTISATTFFGLGDMERGMTQVRKCLHSDPENKACKKLLRQQKNVEKTVTKVNKAFEKTQPMTGVKMLVPTGDDKGLIEEVKEDVQKFKEDGIIPEQAPDLLLNHLMELACQAYYDVSHALGPPSTLQTLTKTADERQKGQYLLQRVPGAG